MSNQFLTATKIGNSGGSTLTTASFTVPANCFLLLTTGTVGGAGDQTVASVVDTAALTWVPYAASANPIGNVGSDTEVWYAVTPSGSPTTTAVTIDFNGGGGQLLAIVQPIMNVNLSGPFDPGVSGAALPAIVENTTEPASNMVATVGTFNTGVTLIAITNGEQANVGAPPPLSTVASEGIFSFRQQVLEIDAMTLSAPLATPITLTSPWTFGVNEQAASMIVIGIVSADNTPGAGVVETGSTSPGSPTIISPDVVTLLGQGVIVVAAGGRANTAPSVVSITDTSGLNWILYAQKGAASAGIPTFADAEVWYAVYGGIDPITTNLTITVTGTEMEAVVMPFTGVDLAGVFDPGASVLLPNYAFTDSLNGYAALDTQITTSKTGTFIAVVGAGNVATSSPALPSGIAEIAYLQQGGVSGIPLSGMAVMGQSQPTLLSSPISVNFPSDWNASGGAGAAIAFAVSGYVSPTVPNVVDITVPSAEMVLENAGFVLGTVGTAYSAIYSAGLILSQSPAAGADSSFGSAVSVVVSLGLEPIRVPLILFEDEPSAILDITNLGLVVGSVNFVNSSIFAAGEIMAQNPAAGTIVASGSLVSFTVSLGQSIASAVFDYEPTVISQYANSPTLLQWLDNCNQYFDQSANVATFISVIWNIDTAIGFGLDILGAIVGVSRLLRIPNAATYFGFANAHSVDWDNFGSKNPGGAGVAPFYTGFNSTEAYLLNDDPYRQLILAKAFANICVTTCPAMNRILQNLYGAGAAYVLNTGPMAISYNFTFIPSAIQLAILEQSGVIPTPPGVAATIVTP
jgi:hypothetical protein